MCNFKSIGDATAVAIATMHSGIQVIPSFMHITARKVVLSSRS